MSPDCIVAGLGEVGGPLFDVLGRSYVVEGVDVAKGFDTDATDAAVLHICYPFQIDSFIGITAGYVERFSPDLVIVHSTIAPGTTSELQRMLPSTPVFYSPVRGKHSLMADELLHYKKFVSGPEDHLSNMISHLEKTGMQTMVMQPTEALELAKILETSYFGMIIAWVQEMSRYADAVGSDYVTVQAFFEEIAFLPQAYWPGHIGGHCVIPNLDMLREMLDSAMIDAALDSNNRFAEDSPD